MNFDTIYLVFVICAIFLSFFFVVRMGWVSQQYKDMIWEDWSKYKRLIPFNKVLLKFWIWNIDKLVEDKK